jgi:hypothetical protein
MIIYIAKKYDDISENVDISFMGVVEARCVEKNDIAAPSFKDIWDDFRSSWIRMSG